MDDHVFDRALIGAALDLAASDGWAEVSVAKAARLSGLDVARARARFPARVAVLMRFGELADRAALAEIATEGPARDRLFDMVMRRIDLHQAHRAGVLAVLRAAPFDPGASLLLGLGLRNSMAWMLDGAGISTNGLRGEVRLQGMLAVWLYTIRAWMRDDSEDLSGTMAALDTALHRAERMSGWTGGRAPSAPGDPPAAASATAGDEAFVAAEEVVATDLDTIEPEPPIVDPPTPDPAPPDPGPPPAPH